MANSTSAGRLRTPDPGVARGRLASGTAHSEERPLRLEAAGAEPCTERAMRIECIDGDRTIACRSKCGAHECLGDVVVARHHRPDLIEKAALTAETIVRESRHRSGRRAPYNGALSRAHSSTVAAIATEDLVVLVGHDLQVGGRQSSHVRRLDAARCEPREAA